MTRKKKVFIEILIILISIIVVFVAGILIWISSLEMPDFNTVASRQMESTTKIYDRTGKILLFAFREKVRRTPVALDAISPNIIKATLAIEDDKFYEHRGISLRGIMRAIYTNLKTNKVQGGSTITQQVVKNALLTREQTIERKIKEVILALKLEQTLSKNQILLMYLNDGPYGGEIYGVEEASQYYFAKSAKDLNTAEAAYLAAIPKNPNLYSPYGKFKDKLEERKNIVLRRMLETGNITEEEYKLAVETKVTFVKKEDNNSKAHHFVFFIKDYLAEKYGEDFVTKGLSVTTTLDYDLQKFSEEEAKKYIQAYIARNQKNNKINLSTLNTGIVVLDAKTGQILTMVGSRDYNDDKIDGKYNIATALRQPGSAMKPIIYASAFESGLTPEVVVFDTPTEFNTTCPPADGKRREQPCYSPQNYDNAWYGPVTIREALGNSRNIPAVKMLYLVGTSNAINFAKRLGITSLKGAERYGLSLALGGGEVSLLEMTGAFLPFSQKGIYHKPTGILEVKDINGKILEEYKEEGYRVISVETSAKISSVLSDNNARSRSFGWNNGMYFGGADIAAKTGTTNNAKDGWIIGYSTDNVVGAWIGKNDNTSFGDVTAALSIVPLWNKIFTYIIKEKYPGSLYKEYESSPSIEGVKCSGFVANDIIQTVIAAQIFKNIKSGDPQSLRWLGEKNSPSCGFSTSTPIDTGKIPQNTVIPEETINTTTPN